MSIPLSSNFELSAQLPLDSRVVVADATARDAIPFVQRFEGLAVYLEDTFETWQLQGGVTNGDWVLVSGAGGGVQSVTGNLPIIVDNTDPQNPVINFDGCDDPIVTDESLIGTGTDADPLGQLDLGFTNPTTVVTIDSGDSPYDILDTDHTIAVDTSGGDVTLNLPLASDAVVRTLYVYKTVADNSLFINTQTGDLVNNLTSYEQISPNIPIQFNAVAPTQWAATPAPDDVPTAALTVKAATTAALANTPTYDNGSSGVGATLTRTGNGVFPSINGVTINVGDRILVKNQADQTQNGVYELTDAGSGSTPWILTRATDSDETDELNGQVVIPQLGTSVNRGKLFDQTTVNPVIGTDNIVYVVSPISNSVTQQNTGTQTIWQVPWWTGVARQLSRGNQNFTFNATAGIFTIKSESDGYSIFTNNATDSTYNYAQLSWFDTAVDTDSVQHFLQTSSIDNGVRNQFRMVSNQMFLYSFDPSDPSTYYSNLQIYPTAFNVTLGGDASEISFIADAEGDGLIGVSSTGISTGQTPFKFPDVTSSTTTLGTTTKVLSVDAFGQVGLYDVSGGGGGSPGGADTNVQYNDSGTFGGDSNFTWDKTNKNFQVGDLLGSGASINVNDSFENIEIKSINMVSLGDTDGDQNNTSITTNDNTSEIILNTIGTVTIGSPLGGGTSTLFELNDVSKTITLSSTGLATGVTPLVLSNVNSSTTPLGAADRLLGVDGSGQVGIYTPEITIGSPVAGTPGSVLFIDGSGNLGEDNARFFWDDTTYHLQIAGNIILTQNSGTNLAGFDVHNTLASWTNAVTTGGVGNMNVYSNWSVVTNAQSDVTKPSWALRLRTDNDHMYFFRVAAGGGTTEVIEWFLNASGNVGMGQNNTSPTANLHLAASTTSFASLRIPGGSAPTSPNEGEMWQTSNHLYVRLNGSTYQLDQQSGSGGTVTSVSVVSANGFAGSVATATTTPAITISTTITGILKGNGTAISAATDADITGKLLTGYVSGAGTVAATDSILQAIQKLNGNISALVTGVSSVSGTSNRITASPTTGAVVVDIAATYVGQTSITTLGTIGTGTWQGTLIGSTYGGTGVNNGSSTITLAGNLVTSGAFALTLTTTNTTNVTLPTTGTLATLAGTETFTNKRITKRVVSMTNATSFTPTGDTADENTQANTQAAGTLTANAPSGTPTDGQPLILRIKCTNAQTWAWNAIYRGSLDLALPTATSGASLTDYMGFIYNSADSKWDLVALSKGY